MRLLFWLIIIGVPIALGVTGYRYRDGIQEFLQQNELLEPDDGLKNENIFTGEPDPEGLKDDGSSTRTTSASQLKVPKLSSAEIARRYPVPNLPSFDQLIDDWNSVSPEIYPEAIILTKDARVEFKSKGRVIGTTTLGIGTSLYPEKMENGVLTCARTKGKSATNVTLPIESTDFKVRVRRNYEKWKKRQHENVRKQREKAAALSNKSNRRNNSDFSEIGPVPKRDSSGVVPVMLASIRNREVKEIEEKNIKGWRWIGLENHEGKAYWAGVVAYEAHTRWGVLNTEGKALIRNGKVVKWIYAYSEEPIR